MIPSMTQPVEDETPRRTGTVTLAGEQFQALELVDAQLMHLGRYARILTKDDVARDLKFDAMERMLKILHSCVPDPKDKDRIIELEEEGKVSLRDMLAFARNFGAGEVEAAPVTVVRRRGRPRKSA